MSKRWARLIGIFLLIPYFSCFEIKEIVKFNKDGSGSFSFQVGIQEQFRAFMAMSRKMQEEKKRKAEEERAAEREKSQDPNMDPELAEMEREERERAEQEAARDPKKKIGDFEASKNKIAQLPGISNVRAVQDEANFQFGIKFDFADVAALNRALHRLQKNPGPQQIEYFTLSRGSLVRKPIVGFQEDFQEKMNAPGEGKMNPAMLGIKFLYITEYSFPGEIRKVSNPRAQVLADKHTVRMEHSMLDPEERVSNVGNTVEFKRWYHACLPFL